EWWFFFFQAEDGIRDWSVTGVQTCALPICSAEMPARQSSDNIGAERVSTFQEGRLGNSVSGGRRYINTEDMEITEQHFGAGRPRSEERRVGKEWRSRWGGMREKKKRRE